MLLVSPVVQHFLEVHPPETYDQGFCLGTGRGDGRLPGL